jgi:RNA polymerase sigma-70 factor (ECF subfamily)
MLNIHIDQETINNCKRKQQQAQGAVYKLCYPDFMKICLRYTDSYEDAANVLHDAFIKIFTRIDTYTGTGDFVGWMRRIIVNTSIDYSRSKKLKNNISMDNIPDIAEEQEEQGFVVDEKHLLELIRELPQKHSLVFNLFVMENYSHDEIAKALDITVASSKWYLFCARKTLQEKVSKLIKSEQQA